MKQDEQVQEAVVVASEAKQTVSADVPNRGAAVCASDWRLGSGGAEALQEPLTGKHHVVDPG